MEDEETTTSQSLGNGSTPHSNIRLTKKAVVVLTKIPESKICALRPPTPEQFYSEDEASSSSDSDVMSELERDSSDSDFSLSNPKTRDKLRKRIKITRHSRTSIVALEQRLQNNAAAAQRLQSNAASAHRPAQKNTVSTKARRPKVPDPELRDGMTVIARKKLLRWERGKVLEVVTKAGGRVKYKVNFELKGKMFVSSHHVALDSPPKLSQLFIGARVVVRCHINRFRFWPGILAELPSRSNHQRFLVFIDDHTPVYVVLPSLHLVCKQLDNPLEDVPESAHRAFMEQYLKDWPYPRLTQYRVGQNLSVELNGEQQRCEVLMVDGSMMHVLFHESQFKEWIHRGSTRLELF